MKLCYPDINKVFDTENCRVNTIIIENQRLMYDFLRDIKLQMEGFDGKALLAENDKILRIDKNLEVLDMFIPFELNQKSLLTKISSLMEQEALSREHYQESMDVITVLQKYLDDISQSMNCDISFNKLSIGSIIKSSGIVLNEEYESLGEKIIDYFELVTEFENRKLFLTVNLRSYISDVETNAFMDTIIRHGYNVIMIENSEHDILINEERLIIDSDLCEIE